jgi:hypothetical protein
MIEKKNMVESVKYLREKLLADCFGYIVNRTRGMEGYLQYEIFIMAFSNFWKSIIDEKVEKKFEYINDVSMLSFFRKGCLFLILDKYKELKKKHLHERYLEDVIRKIDEEEYKNEYRLTIKRLINDRVVKYNVVLDDTGLEIAKETLLGLFEKVGLRCREIVKWFFIEEKSHNEIPDLVEGVSNANTSKVMLNRCMNNLREMYGIIKIESKNKKDKESQKKLSHERD